MKKIVLWLLLAALLWMPGPAPGAEEASAPPMEGVSPGFVYHTLGAAAGLVKLRSPHIRESGGYFALEGAFLSLGFLRHDPFTDLRLPEGAAMACWNADMTLRWTLTDDRLEDAWYSDLLELEDGLLFGIDRSVRGISGQVPSLLMVDKATGVIRWQMDGVSSRVWINDFRLAPDGNILVASTGPLQGETGDLGTLTLLDAATGEALWAVDYTRHYGIQRLGSVCPLGDGLVLYGYREDDSAVLFTDARGAVRGWFTLAPYWDESGGTFLSLLPASGDAVYLCGWETGAVLDSHDDDPYANRTLCLMRLGPEAAMPPSLSDGD